MNATDRKLPVHIVVDLETLGTGPDTVVTSLGAVALRFDPERGVFFEVDDFYVRIDLDQPGRTMTGATVAFWLKQSDEARREVWEGQRDNGREVVEGRCPLAIALARWAGWCGKHEIAGMWSKGNDFDIAILRNLYGEAGLPWKFWLTRDVRTARDALLPDVLKALPANKCPHHALHDARHEAHIVAAFLNRFIAPRIRNQIAEGA